MSTNDTDEAARLAQRLAALAEGDLKNAEHTLLLKDDCPLETVCFHAQQCTEKYLKALLLAHGQGPPRTHDVALLLSLVKGVVRIDLEPGELTPLAAYAVSARYEDDWEAISRSQAEAAVATARRVRTMARALLGNLAPAR